MLPVDSQERISRVVAAVLRVPVSQVFFSAQPPSQAFIQVPVIGPDGGICATLGAWESQPRTPDEQESAALGALARMAQEEMQARELACEQRVAQRRLRCIADSVPATIGYWNRDLRCEFANEAHHAYFGVSAQDIIGMSMSELQGAELFSLNEPHVRLALAGEAQHFERHLMKKDGGAATVDVQYRPDFDETGTVRGFYVLVMDITVLRVARDEALKHAAAKTEFLANMSHEIRTPLNGLLGMTQLLLDTPLSDDQRHWVTLSQSCGSHLLAIVNDVLDFSKIESGALELEKMDFDLADLVEQSCAAVGRTAHAKGLALNVEVELAAPHRLGDPTRIRQVVLNLLTNAVKFTESGSVTLRIAAAQDEERVAFFVVDTGIGMTAEQLPRIFERFTQADSSTSRRFGGSGLGLAICRRLVDIMGGKLCARSEAGSGSTFWFEIPLPAAPPQAMRSLETAAAEAATLDSLRVLVAEDNPINQLVVRKMLQRFGCTATFVATGAQAVDSWAPGRFDVILMDCQMPHMDGFEATRRIRASGRDGAVVPIIALTAGALDSDREQATLAGMSDFLTKPVFAEALGAALRRACIARCRTDSGSESRRSQSSL